MTVATTGLNAPPARRLTRGTMAAYGFGSVAYGVKDSGFGTFLLLFYSQVLGVPSATVGLVVMLALFLDAVIDPAVGFFSDRTRSRWGRRHPWMYASAIPIAIGWVALWNPPVMDQTATLIWLFVWAVVVRTAVSCFEVPSVALTPELSSDYDERTRIMAYRYLFGWAGGLTIMIAAYLYFLAPAPASASRAAFGAMGIAGAVLIAGAILVSALGTHREIPNLPRSVPVTGTLGDAFRELLETVRNKGFVVLMLAGLCAYTLQGIGYALSNYMYAFVWRIEGPWLVYVVAFLFVGVVLAFFLAPRVTKRVSKPLAGITFALFAALFHTGPYWLRLAGVIADASTPGSLAIYLSCVVLGTMCSVSGFIIGGSMMADVVEDSEAKTGRRSEGVFFAGSFFVQKCTSGLGIFAAGVILAVAGFPAGAVPGQVSVETIDRLTLIFGGIYLTLAAIGAFTYSFFPFGRAEHEARLGRLAGAASVDAAPREPA
ncbi:MAG: MFS transporter [Pseudomonadota bacterium]